MTAWKEKLMMMKRKKRRANLTEGGVDGFFEELRQK